MPGGRYPKPGERKPKNLYLDIQSRYVLEEAEKRGMTPSDFAADAIKSQGLQLAFSTMMLHGAEEIFIEQRKRDRKKEEEGKRKAREKLAEQNGFLH